jgi:hypothetical protein
MATFKTKTATTKPAEKSKPKPMDFLEKTVEECDDRDSNKKETPTKLTCWKRRWRKATTETLTRRNADKADFESTRLPLAGIRDFQRRRVVREKEMDPRGRNKK